MTDVGGDGVEIRAFRDADLEAVVALWNRAKRAAYPFLPLEQTRTLDEDRAFFLASIAPRRVWVCTERGELLGFLSMSDGDYVDRLYVDPSRLRHGIGRRLMAHAATVSPDSLRLHTHQQNWPARDFYEGLGFRAVAFGLSPAPEGEPDVEYVRRAAGVPPPAAKGGSYSPTWFATFAAGFDAARTRAEVDFLARHLPLPDFRRVLDVPCGLARHAVLFAERGYDVTAADLDADAVAAARSALGMRGTVVQTDLRDLAVCGGDFDAVVNLWQSFGMFDDATNAVVLEGIGRRVRPGGRVIVDVYDLDRFVPATGTLRRRRTQGDVEETTEFVHGRLRVRLAYSWSTDADVFDWRLYRRAEFRTIAAAAGLSVVAVGEDFDGPPTGGVPRAQYVMERRSVSGTEGVPPCARRESGPA